MSCAETKLCLARLHMAVFRKNPFQALPHTSVAIRENNTRIRIPIAGTPAKAIDNWLTSTTPTTFLLCFRNLKIAHIQ